MATEPSTPTVSVVVPAGADSPDLDRCLASLRAAAPAPDEIIVVIDGAGSGAADVAGRDGVRVLTLPVRGGPARARNHGAAVARSEILVFFDADVLPHADVIGRVRAQFDQDAALAAVIGSYDAAPAARNFLSQYKNLLHHYIHQSSRTEASTFWGACGAVRRDVFLSVGGFDERYRRPSIEDIELGSRLVRAGHRIRLVPELQVTHLKRWGVWSLLQSDFVDRAVPWTMLIWSDRRLINDLNLRISARASVVLVGLCTVALAGAFIRPAPLLATAGIGALGLLALNAPVYAFLWRERGFFFALRSIPWHWLTYWCSGIAFALGTAWWWLSCIENAFTIRVRSARSSDH